jgi:hypothetical protein
MVLLGFSLFLILASWRYNLLRTTAHVVYLFMGKLQFNLFLNFLQNSSTPSTMTYYIRMVFLFTKSSVLVLYLPYHPCHLSLISNDVTFSFAHFYNITYFLPALHDERLTIPLLVSDGMVSRPVHDIRMSMCYRLPS